MFIATAITDKSKLRRSEKGSTNIALLRRCKPKARCICKHSAPAELSVVGVRCVFCTERPGGARKGEL